MTDSVCTRCNNRFYTAYMHGEIVCPYCGFNVKAAYGDKRATKRAVIRKGCVLEAREAGNRAETVDLSTGGAGVRLGNGVDLKENDTVKIIIEELEIDFAAEVVWLRQKDGFTSAGLKFL